MTARARQPRNDGMTGITLMPFPFLNPLNWGAMTPVHALESALVLAQLNLDFWRSAADACRVGCRRQQDEMLNMLRSQMAHAHEAGPADPFGVEPAVKRMAGVAPRRSNASEKRTHH